MKVGYIKRPMTFYSFIIMITLTAITNVQVLVKIEHHATVFFPSQMCKADSSSYRLRFPLR